jgi:hypothetical protein
MSIPVAWSLGVSVTTLVVAVLASWLANRRDAARGAQA